MSFDFKKAAAYYLAWLEEKETVTRNGVADLTKYRVLQIRKWLPWATWEQAEQLAAQGATRAECKVIDSATRQALEHKRTEALRREFNRSNREGRALEITRAVAQLPEARS